MGKRIVEVWGKKVEIDVYQKSKSVWIATGTYLDKPYQGQGRTETQAASAWKEAARYANN